VVFLIRINTLLPDDVTIPSGGDTATRSTTSESTRLAYIAVCAAAWRMRRSQALPGLCIER